MPTGGAPAVIIVGGGLSGSLVAAQLLRRATSPLRVTIAERSARIGPGAAYGTPCPEHFLNVRARGMSAVAGEPDHFTAWLQGEGRPRAGSWGASGDPESFAPRGLYGEYIADLLARAERGAAPGVTLDRRRAEVVAIEEAGGHERALLDDGPPISADFVVLALGNAAPSDPDWLPRGARERGWYLPDPWSVGALDRLGAEEDVLILGTNLTMIDVAIALARNDHRGTLHAVSRRGLLPCEHAASSIEPDAGIAASAANWARQGAPPLTAMVRAVRASARAGPEWRAVIDALRPHTQAIWSSLSHDQRRRFLRHLRPYWEVHRHRAVPENMRDLGTLLASGRLRTTSGTVASVREEKGTVRVRLRPRGTSALEELAVRRIVNATGPAPGVSGLGRLVEGLVRAGRAREGSVGIGLDARPDGTLLDREGAPAPRLAMLGPPLRGVLWETTAVPEIREQAASMAARILQRVSGRPER